MKRLAAIVALVLVLAACGTANTPSGSPLATLATTTTPTQAPVSTQGPSAAPVVRDLDIYPLPRTNDLFRGAHVASIAGGRAGVVLLGTDAATGALISWTSADGDAWARNWLPGTTFGGGSPEWLVGGDFGYLALGWRSGGNGLVRALWSSSDGIAWSLGATTGLPDGVPAGIVAGPSGILADIEGADGRGVLAFSTDGRTWQRGSLPAGAVPNPSGMVPLPDGFLVTGDTEGTDASGGTTEVRTAWRSADGLRWTVDEALGNAIVALPDSIEGWALTPYGAIGWDVGGGLEQLTSTGLTGFARPPTANGYLVGSPAGLLWVEGTSVDGTCAVAWQYDGLMWAPLHNASASIGCIDPLGPFILGTAPLRDGAVVFGLLGQDYQRVAWLIRPAGNAPSGEAAGGPVPVPPASAIPDPLAVTFDHLSACPPRPTDVDVLIALDPVLGAGCFGDADISFRAWVVDPGEGYGGTCEAFTPMWIRECVLPDYLLSSGAGVDFNSVGGDELHAMRSPSATGDLVGVGRWVQVTGHFDDPISPTCRYFSGETNIGFDAEPPAALAVMQCRLVFVVTHLRTVPAA
jgi:hypothetical protein